MSARAADLPLDAPELAAASRSLAEQTGLSLSGVLARTLRAAALAAAEELGVAPRALCARAAARDPAALAALLEHAVVGETHFFRHPEQLALLAARLAPAPEPLAIWCAGCASGEEPYSLAIALLEAGRDHPADAILATDVSERALAAAREAAYGRKALRHAPAAALARWFTDGPARRPVAAVRARVRLARHNLVADPPPPGPFDAVVCRNVLIYFEPATAAAVLYRLLSAVRPGGLLLLGPVELPLASALPVEWVEEGGATLVRRPLT